MPNQIITLIDASKHGTDAGKTVSLVENVADAALEVFTVPVFPKKGFTYYSSRRTVQPTVSFCRASEGLNTSKSTWTMGLMEMFRLASIYDVDQAIADAHARGAQAFLDIEGQGHVRGALTTLARQMFYGTVNDPLGFVGFKELLPKGAPITVDAAGTTAATASSVYAVKVGEEHVSFSINENTPLVPSKITKQQKRLTDGSMMPIYCSGIDLWIGLCVANENCIGRILNVTADSGKGVTDSLLAQLLEKFPVGFKPDYFFMSGRSLTQLRQSRNNADHGPEMWAHGVRVIEAGGIGNTDTIE